MSMNRSTNTMMSIVITIVIPVVILTRFSGDEYLGPVFGLIVALSFPLVYGLYDFRERKNVNLYSVLGVVSVVLTGGIGLLKLDPGVVALKEAAVPLIIGLTILASQKTRWPLMPKLIDGALNSKMIHDKLTENGKQYLYDQRLRRATYLFAASFFVSTVLNYVLARLIVISDPGTVAFNEELGRLTALSYPVIVIPSMAVMIAALQYLISGIKQLTGLSLSQILKYE